MSKILVVDDNEDNRAIAQATLEDEGYVVTLASSGAEGFRLFESEQPDCVLLDVRMPGMDGFEVCTRMRQLSGGEGTPIVFLTAHRDLETFDRALRAGGDDFLTKPVRPTELVVRIQAALKLRRMGAELREHLDIVRHQRDDLMRLQLQKERLTAFVVHDLKNPLNSMDLHAQLLLRDPELPPRSQSAAAQIRTGARSLLRLILNLLDISKSEEGELVPRFAEVDLETLISDLFDAHELEARNSGLTLRSNLAVPNISGDVDLLRRVLENLLDNAIRHATEGTEIRIDTMRRDSAVEIRVADAGPGIPADMREKIFERFVQVEGGEHPLTRSGRGLGLAFCKLAILAHGGTIWVDDGNPGSVFCVSLPYDPE